MRSLTQSTRQLRLTALPLPSVPPCPPPPACRGKYDELLAGPSGADVGSEAGALNRVSATYASQVRPPGLPCGALHMRCPALLAQ